MASKSKKILGETDNGIVEVTVMLRRGWMPPLQRVFKYIRTWYADEYYFNKFKKYGLDHQKLDLDDYVTRQIEHINGYVDEYYNQSKPDTNPTITIKYIASGIGRILFVGEKQSNMIKRLRA
jgi:hypothetical protein